ncbi:MMPL family transporter [Bogoriella caseilytica]|uniref:RND superfamily putative drug exporter n=1 Tax=Bogoriella caseilytica TaxID=56055 RepID=A0A3N2BDR5_9MICO|nr:MMPL family transporter [Bogoriella caseilytica]ROR73386.1 RND superfamily putative drug exporter [Bogoriella caseilytica]
MSSVLYRIGRWSASSRRLVLLGWVAVLALAGAMAGFLGEGLDDEVSIPGTEGQDAMERLNATFPEMAGASASLIVVAPDGADITDADFAEAIDTATETIEDLEQVDAVTPLDEDEGALISDDSRAAMLSITLDSDQSDVMDSTLEALLNERDALEQALPEGSEAEMGGEIFNMEFPGVGLMEVAGVVISFVVLLITLGSVVAAGLPLLTALLGVGVAVLLVFAATALGPVNSTTPMLALMLGMAVGIDYALLLIARHREELGKGGEVIESAARATATAGSAIAFAGVTNVIALLGLSFANIPFLTIMGVAGSVAVAIAVAIAVTLVPALIAFSGERMRPRAARRARAEAAAAETGAAAAPSGTETPRAEEAQSSGPSPSRFFTGWVKAVTRFPALTIAVVVAGIAVLAFPATDLRLAMPGAGFLDEEHHARHAYELTEEHFGEGYNAVLMVTATIVTSDDPLGVIEDIAGEIEELDGVVEVPLAVPNPSADTGIIQVVPSGGPEALETEELVRDIRALRPQIAEDYGVDIAVTGFTAITIDVSEQLGDAMLPFGIAVVGLCLILMMMIFRSVVVPIKASLGYLLSVGAAFGVVTLVFQDGWAADLLDVPRLGPVISFMPIILMGVLFGLAMDYECFLVARMREEYVRTGDARQAVVRGFQGSAKVVTATATIMVAVFFGFVPGGDIYLKPIALGLAVGVAVDAFIVRMTLVPAVMTLLGRNAWWIPRRLDRIMPFFDVEGERLEKQIALTDWAPQTAAAARELVINAPNSDDPWIGPVEFSLAENGALGIKSRSRAAVTAVVLAVAGRLAPDTGDLKVTGLVLPDRSAAVRHRVAVIDAVNAPDVPAELRRLAAQARRTQQRSTPRPGRLRIVVLDRADVLTDPTARRAVADRLAELRAAGVAVVLGLPGAGADATRRLQELAPDAALIDLDAVSAHPDPAGSRLQEATAS